MAEGRHEFGHIYFRMKSWALWDDQIMPISLQTTVNRDVLVTGVTAFWERGGADDCGSIGLFQGEVDQLEVLFIVLKTKIRPLSGVPYGPILTWEPTCSSISMLTNASKACSKWGGMSR